MRDTKLILVDGLPGSGKTTTATWLASRLLSDGHAVALYPENHPEHPLYVEDVYEMMYDYFKIPRIHRQQQILERAE
jgi:thymidylate kinase